MNTEQTSKNIFTYKSVKVKRKPNNMDQVMDIVKLNSFSFFKERS